MILTDKLSNIANAIRSKTGKSEEMTLDEMPVEIEGIFGNKVEKPFDCHSVTFVYGDKSYVRSVADGDTCADPVERGLIPTPTKESTVQYNYTYAGGWSAWDGGSADANILKNITEDKTVYAVFTATTRLYTITWLDEDGTELPGQKQWAYGTVPSYTPAKPGFALVRWTPKPTTVTEDATYTAEWAEVIGGECGDSATWTFDADTGSLTISGTGAMANYTGKTQQPWYEYVSQIKTLTINQGITDIGNHAFEGLTGITQIYLPNSVVNIGEYAFASCSEVNSISAYLPTFIGRYAFYGITKTTTMGTFSLRYKGSTGGITYKANNGGTLTTTYASGAGVHWGLYQITSAYTGAQLWAYSYTKQ